MSTGKIVALGVAVSMALLLIVGCASAVGLNNSCVAHEANIKAQHDQNKNNYDNYFKKLMEAAQVTEMYRDDMKKIYDGVMTGRYGAEGSKAMMQWIQEHNPQLDSSLYRQLQQIIEAGRNSFEADQKALIDKKRSYELTLKSFPGSMVVGVLGFPKIDLDKYGIVTSDATEKAFEEKKSDPHKLRPEEKK